MPGPFDYAVALLSFCAEIFVVVWIVKSRSTSRYLSLTLYMLAAALATIVQFFTLHKYGLASAKYIYSYYYSDALLTILLFFVIMGFYQLVFDQMGVSKYIKGASILLLSLTALFSFQVVHQNQDHLTSRFVVAMGQNLYFVGVVLTYLLWGVVLKLRETRTRLIQLVLSLGIFFSAEAAAYALRNLFPGLEAYVLKWIPPLMGTFLPLAWAYTFTKIPEEARLLTARLAANHQ